MHLNFLKPKYKVIVEMKFNQQTEQHPNDLNN